MQQEPGTESEILNGVQYVRPGGGFVPNFQLFAKIEVNGATEHPLYTYLKVPDTWPAMAILSTPPLVRYLTHGQQPSFERDP